MLPNLDDGQMLLVNRNAYQYFDFGGEQYYPFDPPERGDVIVFEPPTGSDKPYIKRVIGLPGEEVTFGDGKVFIDGELLDEDYIDERTGCGTTARRIVTSSCRTGTSSSSATTAPTRPIRDRSGRCRSRTSSARRGFRIGPPTTSASFPMRSTPTTRPSRRRLRIALTPGSGRNPLPAMVFCPMALAQVRIRVVNFSWVQQAGRGRPPW